MKISVIVPTYKPQKYLWDCLDSLSLQTFSDKDFEIILVLNGCNEPYNTAILDYMENHPSVQWNYIQTDTPGVSNARNMALDRVRGEYVAFIDDDDFVSPKYLEELYAHASSNTISLCYPFAFSDGEPLKQLPYEITEAYDNYCGKRKMKASGVRKFFSGPCMKLIPISYIGDRRFDVRFKNGEDSLFMFLISDRMKWVDFSSRDAVYYRRFRPNSAVTTKQSLGYVARNSWNMVREYTRIYFNAPSKYSFRRYCMNFLGAIHTFISRLIKGKV